MSHTAQSFKTPRVRLVSMCHAKNINQLTTQRQVTPQRAAYYHSIILYASAQVKVTIRDSNSRFPNIQY